MKSVDELRRNIKSKGVKLRKQQEELEEAELCGGAIRKRLTDVMKRMSSHQSKSEKLMHDKAQLEEALRLREVVQLVLVVFQTILSFRPLLS